MEGLFVIAESKMNIFLSSQILMKNQPIRRKTRILILLKRNPFKSYNEKPLLVPAVFSFYSFVKLLR